MVSAKEHYDHFLGPYYSWLSGGLGKKVEENRKFFFDHDISPRSSKVAVDLGAGPGFQSIPLAESGFNVIAIDMNRHLLGELRQNTQGLSVVAVEDNLLNFTRHSPTNNEVIVCMGDTLLHLQSFEDVQNLFENAYNSLANNGRLILAFRDMTRELTGLDRFIPVRSDATKIFTCFVEYKKKHILVHDILYEKNNQQWIMKKSLFRKLRILPQWTRNVLEGIGFRIETYDVGKGMVTIVACRN